MGRRGRSYRGNPQLLPRGPHGELSVRRQFNLLVPLFRTTHLAQQARIARVNLSRPDLLLPRPHSVRGVGNPSAFIGLAAANVHESSSIRRDAETGNGQAFVAVIMRYLPSAEVGCICHPEVANSFRVENPSHPAAVRSRDKIGWKRRTHHLLKCEAGGGRLAGEKARNKSNQNSHESRSKKWESSKRWQKRWH